jgi:prolyl-tRNA synthetase
MPSGRTLQIGSIHQYKDNFAKPYDISYETEDGKHTYCHQTTYGMSERLLGALIGIHGDNKGLVMPPEVAPIQVVIIPIIFKGKEKDVLEACNKIHKKLMEKNLRSHIDDRDITPGNKYYDWELKGVPLRVEIGPRDVEKNEIVIVYRNTGEKVTTRQDDAVKTIIDKIDKIANALFSNAKKILDENMQKVLTIDEAKDKKGIIEIPWCGSQECALEVEDIIEGNTLGEPIDNAACNHPCPICNGSAKTWMRFAKTY